MTLEHSLNQLKKAQSHKSKLFWTYSRENLLSTILLMKQAVKLLEADIAYLRSRGYSLTIRQIKTR